MMKNTIILICVIFMLLLSSTVAISEIRLDKFDIIESQSSSNNNGLPDLIVDKITIKYNSNTEMNNYNTRIKNIGDTRVPGGRFFNLKTVINKIGFDMSIEYYDTFTGGIITNLPLDPGESFTIPINCFDFDFPRFGFFQFNCIINEEKIIEESDYNNNVRTKTFFVIKIFPWLQFPIAFPVIWIPREG